jgi:hypothetical protein
MESVRPHAALPLLGEAVRMTCDSNVHVGCTRKPRRFARLRADTGSEPNCPAAQTQRHVLQSSCQYTYQDTTTSMFLQPINKNRWRQRCQTEAGRKCLHGLSQMPMDLDRLRQSWGRQALCRGPPPVPKGPRCCNVFLLGNMDEEHLYPQFYRNSTPTHKVKSQSPASPNY